MTRDDYDAGLELLQRIVPRCPLLPRLQRQGFTRTNARYLEKLLAENVDQKPHPTRVRKLNPDAAPPQTEEWKRLQARKSNLYKQRAKLSNRFHDYPDSQAERANLSEEIRHVQIKIKALQQQIYHYSRTGKVLETPPPPTERRYEGVELLKRRQAVNSKMSRLRSNLKQKATAKPDRVAEWERQLKDCERERESLNEQIRQVAL